MNKFKNFVIGIAIILGSIAYFAIVFLTTSALIKSVYGGL